MKNDQKKLQWLKENGGDAAVEKLGYLIKQMGDFAQAQGIPSKENEMETDEEVIVVEEKEVEATVEYVTTEQFKEFIDEIADTVIAPLATALTEQIAKVKELEVELAKVGSMYKSLTKVDEIIDTLPNAAAVSHVQNRLSGVMKQFTTDSVATKELANRKPVENIEASGIADDFDAFLGGL